MRRCFLVYDKFITCYQINFKIVSKPTGKKQKLPKNMNKIIVSDTIFGKKTNTKKTETNNLENTDEREKNNTK